MEFRQELFHFRWMKCPDGYQIVRGEALTAVKPGKSLIGSIQPDRPHVDQVRPLTEAQEYYSVMIEVPDTHLQLAELSANEYGALEFATRFGLLGGSYDRPPDRMAVGDFLHFQQSVKNLINPTRRKNEEIAASFWKEFPPTTTRFHIAIDPDSRKIPVFQIIPANLKNFIILQVSSELEGGIEWRKCANPRCRNAFRIASGRGAVSKKIAHTKRKTTCSDACRKALQRLKKS